MSSEERTTNNIPQESSGDANTQRSSSGSRRRRRGGRGRQGNGNPRAGGGKRRNPHAKKRNGKNGGRKQYDELSKSVGAVILNSRNHILLVFQQKNQYWEFPKGKVEGNERELETLRREVYEETGITRFRMLRGFRKAVYYDFHFENRLIRRKVIYFLAKTEDRVRISHEHTRYAWLPFDKALKRLKHENQRRILKQAMKRLQEPS